MLRSLVLLFFSGFISRFVTNSSCWSHCLARRFLFICTSWVISRSNTLITGFSYSFTFLIIGWFIKRRYSFFLRSLRGWFRSHCCCFALGLLSATGFFQYSLLLAFVAKHQLFSIPKPISLRCHQVLLYQILNLILKLVHNSLILLYVLLWR